MVRNAMLVLAALSVVSRAHAATTATVHVAVSSSLESHSAILGPRELDALRSDLKDSVLRALQHSGGGVLQPREVDLVIEDAKPNHPTAEELGRNVSLSMRSVSIGGARISGQVTDARGVSHPLDFSYYATDLRDSRGAATWTDADRAFDLLGERIAQGRLLKP